MLASNWVCSTTNVPSVILSATFLITTFASLMRQVLSTCTTERPKAFCSLFFCVNKGFPCFRVKASAISDESLLSKVNYIPVTFSFLRIKIACLIFFPARVIDLLPQKLSPVQFGSGIL